MVSPQIRPGDRLIGQDDEWIVEAVDGEMLTARSGETTVHWSTNYVEYAGIEIQRLIEA